MSEKPIKKLDCEDIQLLFTDYLSRELGDARSAAVREHLRKCDACQAAATEIDSTISLLKADSPLNIPDTLSAKSRKRMYRVYKHPILSWLDSNQTLITVLALVALMTYLGTYLLLFSQPEPFNEDDYTIVNIGHWDGQNYTNEVPTTNMPAPPLPDPSPAHDTLWMLFAIIGGIVAVLLLRWLGGKKNLDRARAHERDSSDIT